MISLPIVDWSTGWSALIAAITLGVCVSAGVVVALLWAFWGTAATLRVAALIITLSWLAEAIGSRFGFPFGGYSYTAILQPQLFNVPIQISLGWLMMMPPSWAVAQTLSAWFAPRWQFPAFIGLSALAMTAWDLFLDPMMVTWGIWIWDEPGSYFGIPGVNYLGWLLISALITLTLRPGKLPVTPLLIIYTAIWLLKSVGLGLFWGIHGPAIVGFVCMGAITIFAWRAFLNEN